MARFIGDQNQTAFINESGTYANTSGAGVWAGLIQSISPDDNNGTTKIRYQGSASRNVAQFTNGALDYTGTLSLYPQDLRFLAYALGSCVDGGSPSPYTHVITELNNGASWAYTSGADNPFPSFTLEHAQRGLVAGLNFVRTYKGCVVNQLTLTAAQGEPVTMDVDWIAQSGLYSSGAPTSITEDTTRPFLWSDVKVHIPSGTIISETRSVQLSINNNLDPRHYDNASRLIKVPAPGNRDYSISMTVDGTSENVKTFYDQYFGGGAGSTFNMMLEINASAGSRDAYFVFSGCILDKDSAPGGFEGVQEQTLNIIPKNCRIDLNDLVFKYNPW